jgi:LPS-assembly lipoprotein
MFRTASYRIRCLGKAASMAAVAALLLAGCGFQMRGSFNLPFDTLYVPTNSSVGVELKRNIAAGTATRTVNTPAEAQAQLLIAQDTREKVILSLNTAGRVREFQLRHKVGFRVIDAAGREYLPLNEITLTRDVSFNDAQLLAKEAEETLLYRDMQTDMVQQILRRLGGARAPVIAKSPPDVVTPGRESPQVPAAPAVPIPPAGAQRGSSAAPTPQAPSVPQAPAASTATPY